MKQIVTIIFTLSVVCSFGQTKMDSLQHILDTTANDSIKLRIHFQIGAAKLGQNPEIALSHATAMEQLLNDTLTPIYLVEKGRLKGAAYWQMGNFKESLKHLQEAAAYNKILGDSSQIAQDYSNVGLLYFELGEYEAALDNLFNSLKLSYRLKDKMAERQACTNIALIYENQEDYKQCLEYHKRARKLALELGSKHHLEESNVGVLYSKLDSMELAEKYLKNALVMAQEVEDHYVISLASGNLADLYMKKDKYEKAKYYYNQSLTSAKISDNTARIGNVSIGLATLAMQQSNFKAAIEYAETALKMGQKNNDKRLLLETYSTLASAYQKAELYKESAEAYQLYIQYDDSLLDEEISHKLANQESEFELEVQQMKINQLEAEKAMNALQQDQQKWKIYGLTGVLLLALVLFIFMIRSAKIKNRINNQLQLKNELLSEQKMIIEEKNLDITSSLAYAQHLQTAILPSEIEFEQHFKQSFLLHLPKDIVSGDFSWVEETKEAVYFAVADCTGHGVPGAMMSVLSSNLLFDSLSATNNEGNPAMILDHARMFMVKRLNRIQKEQSVKDGMDIAFCKYHPQDKLLEFAGANNDLIIIRGEEEIRISGDKMPVGVSVRKKPAEFTNHKINLEDGDMIYLFSDGFPDQFGGIKGKKLKYKKFINELKCVARLPTKEQYKHLHSYFEKWKGDLEQIDDVCILGVRV